MKMFYCLILILCPLWNWAQTSIPISPLAIGDKVPDIQFNNVLNAPYTSTSLAAAADKLLLVDFWATWCASCIKEFPKLDGLLEKFKGDLQVLLVNNPQSGDNEQKINAFLEKKRSPAGKKYSMPVILNDKQLAQWFPHFGIPHIVWIYKSKVIAITGGTDVTAANIQAVLGDKGVDLAVKADQMDFDACKPLIENGNGGVSAAILYRSMFTRFLNGAAGSIGQEIISDSSLKRRYFINKPLLTLYHYAFPDLPTNRVVADEKLAAYIYCDTINSRWKMANNFCYEQWMPYNTSSTQQQRWMQADLDRQFGIISQLENRIIDCYVIKLKDSTLLRKSKMNLPTDGLQKLETGNWVLQNSPLSHLLTDLNNQSSGKAFFPVVLDETGYTEPVSIDLKVNSIHNLAALQKVLPQYGLELMAAKRELKVLVLTKSTFIKQTN